MGAVRLSLLQLEEDRREELNRKEYEIPRRLYGDYVGETLETLERRDLLGESCATRASR